MRALMLVLLLTTLPTACATGDAASSVPTTTVARVPLRGADCLDPTTARSWHEVSSTEVRVDSGRRKYRLTLGHVCSLLGNGPAIAFVGDPITGRVCGNYGDAIVVGRGERCHIDRIELIDQDTWNATANEQTAEASGSITR